MNLFPSLYHVLSDKKLSKIKLCCRKSQLKSYQPQILADVSKIESPVFYPLHGSVMWCPWQVYKLEEHTFKYEFLYNLKVMTSLYKTSFLTQFRYSQKYLQKQRKKCIEKILLIKSWQPEKNYIQVYVGVCLYVYVYILSLMYDVQRISCDKTLQKSTM